MNAWRCRCHAPVHLGARSIGAAGCGEGYRSQPPCAWNKEERAKECMQIRMGAIAFGVAEPTAIAKGFPKRDSPILGNKTSQFGKSLYSFE